MPNEEPEAVVAAPPRIDQPAPDFEAPSTHGTVNLRDYRGKWLVFFAHPADFTPVCASELVAFAKRADEFAAINCSLVALSVDSVYSHLAWRKNLEEHFGTAIDYPIIADVSLEISRRYGMLQNDGGRVSTVRALFVIDDRGILRAMLWYPPPTGRSVAEVLRLVHALQTADRLKVVTPEGWQPGAATVEHPPDTVAAAEAADDLARGCVDWYYTTRSSDSD